MSSNAPTTIPEAYAAKPEFESAYRQGWNHGHGIACHNVPRLGDKLFLEQLGRVTVDAENIREVHQALCFASEANSRQFSPFEFTAHKFNSADCDEDGNFDPDKEGAPEALWEAFEQGTDDAIFADLAEYDGSDYGIEPDETDETDETDELI